MSEALEVRGATAVEAPSAGMAFLSMIDRASRDPSVDVAKMQQLMEMQERWEARQAEAAFNSDFAAAMLEMPRVVKRGVKDMGAKGAIPYALYEDLDLAIRPIEAKYGFARSFSTRIADKVGTVMILRLTHRAGHSITSERFCPPDPGPGRNETQALGSGDSYGRRYLTLSTWNIITVGADDDGAATSYVSKVQGAEIKALVQECKLPDDRVKTMLKWAGGADSIDHIEGKRFDAVMARLKTVKAEMGVLK